VLEISLGARDEEASRLIEVVPLGGTEWRLG
jgi:hypothetical protein